MGTSPTINENQLSNTANVAALADDPYYLRKLSLVVGDANGDGVDLSALEVHFAVRTATVQTPHTLEARIYNMAPKTFAKLGVEYVQIALSAGYQNGPYGLIFGGLIAQVKHGKLDATTTYVDIIATDGDYAYNYSVVNASLAKGSTYADEQKLLIQSLKANVSEADAPAGSLIIGNNPDLPTGKSLRGQVFWGMSRDRLRNFATNTGTQWRIQSGAVDFIPKLGYIPGDAVVLSPSSGLIGVPELTIDGINARVLLNNNIRTGRIVKIDASLITQTNLITPTSASDPFFLPSTDPGGLYKVYSLVHTGHTLGNEWYTEIVCEAMNGTLPISSRRNEAVINGA